MPTTAQQFKLCGGRTTRHALARRGGVPGVAQGAAGQGAVS